MLFEAWKYLFAALVPLFGAGVEDARSSKVMDLWFWFIFVLGLGLNLELFLAGNVAYPLFAVGFSFLIALMVKLKPSFLEKGDSRLLFSLAFLYSLNFVFVLGLTILFSVLWNVVKRRPLNTPLPLAPFLFVSASLINAFILTSIV